MNIYISAFIVLQVQGKILSHNVGKTKNGITIGNNINDKLNFMDVFTKDLLNQHWKTEDTPCLNKLLDIINNVKNSTLWAVWVWESMQTPAGLLYGSRNNLGNYDQCMNSPWLETHPEFRTQYCLADIKLSDTDPTNTIGDPYISVRSHINSVTKHSLKFNKIIWGVCIPAECKMKSTSNFVHSLLKNTHVGPKIHQIDVKHCQVAGTTEEMSWGTYFLVIFLVSLFVITVTCTMINRAKPSSHNSLGNKLIKAFCLRTNTSYLNKISEDDIKVLHGIRVLAAFTVISFHVILLSHIIGFSNSLTLDKDLDRLNIKSTLRAEYAVDTFLLMSGLLKIKSLMAVGNINPFKAILKRYLRFIVLMGISIICSINIGNYIGDGPVWPLMIDGETKACKKNWLISLLMLGNYVDTDNICYPVMWTVPCDFHLSVIATILYCIYKKNQKKGFMTFAILMMASLIIPGIVNYYQNLPLVSSFDFVLAEQHKKMFLNSSYMMTHLRGGPYFIGIALGYFMSTYKPDRHRNMFSKCTSLIGLLVASTIAIKIIMLGVSLQNKTDSGVLMSFAYTSLHRSIWALAISVIIFVCEYGSVPLFGAMLTWSFFIPLSKISYCIYLVHIIVVGMMLATTRSPLQYNASVLILNSIGAISISCIASVLLHLFVEAPTNRIIDIMINIKVNKNENKPTGEFKNSVLNNNNEKKNI